MSADDALPPGYGQGWLSANARDLMRICIGLGGYDRETLLRRVAVAAARHKGTTGTDCVERILDAMFAEASP